MKILFFMMSGKRTGSEVSLFNYINHADRTRLSMAVACPTDAELLHELPNDVPAFVYGSSQPSTLWGAAWRRLSSNVTARNDEHPAIAISRQYGADAWYINTIIQPEILRVASQHSIPCIVNSHELEQMLWLLDDAAQRELVDVPKLVIAGSQAVADVLKTLGRVDQIEVCYENIDHTKITADESKSREFRRALRIPDNAFVWAMAGTRDPNKNPLAFVEAAKAVSNQWGDAHFIWIGGKDNGYSAYAKGRAADAQISEKVHWLTPEAVDYYHYLNLIDGFALTSTRDSFPLVMIEAAALGKPIVSFNSGGIREFLSDGMGEIVQSHDPSDLAEAMVRVMRQQTPVNRETLRRRAKDFDTPNCVGRWQRVIEDHLSVA